MPPVAPAAADVRGVQGGQARGADVPSSPAPESGEREGAGIHEADRSGLAFGAGSGPYRAGTGVQAPYLLREVRADYADDARRANIEGEVLLEIVVRRDGTVGRVRVVHGLGGGLSDRAVEAVRQWRFAPARMNGIPVDVIVEVGVDFSLR